MQTENLLKQQILKTAIDLGVLIDNNTLEMLCLCPYNYYAILNLFSQRNILVITVQDLNNLLKKKEVKSENGTDTATR